jgi:predicted nucleic acid-binding protein
MTESGRYLLDSNIHDKLIDERLALERFKLLTEEGEKVVFSTHIQADEIARTPNSERVHQLGNVPVQRVPTSGVVLDASRFDEARFSEAEPIETLRGDNWPKHTRDALIAATAGYESATLVTEDRGLRTRARARGIAVIDWPHFRSSVLGLDPEEG